MDLNRTPSLYDRKWRNEENANWETLEQFINKFDGSRLIEQSYNLFNKNAVVPGTLDATGKIQPSDDVSVTAFMPFKPGAYFNVKPTGKLTQFYDKDFNYIDGFLASADFPVLSPPGTAYVRMAI